MDSDLTNFDLLEVARRVVWFKAPHEALHNQVLFLNHAMTYGDVEDVLAIRRFYDDAALRDSLRKAHPGIFDPRSWAYWHTVLGMLPVPPMPVRRLSSEPGARSAGDCSLVRGQGGFSRRSPPAHGSAEQSPSS